MWEIAMGAGVDVSPFSGNDREEAIRKITEEEMRPRIDPTWPVEFSNLMARCWHHTPAQRPGFVEICSTLNKLIGVPDDMGKLRDHVGVRRAFTQVTCEATYTASNARLVTACSTPLDQVWVASSDGLVRVFTSTGECVGEVSTGEQRVLSLVCSADYMWVSISNSRESIVVFDIMKLGKVATVDTGVEVNQMTSAGTHMWCLSSKDDLTTISLINCQNLQMERQFRIQTLALSIYAVSPSRIWAGADGYLMVFNGQQLGSLLHTLKSEKGRVTHITKGSFPNHVWTLAGMNRAVTLWDSVNYVPISIVEV